MFSKTKLFYNAPQLLNALYLSLAIAFVFVALEFSTPHLVKESLREGSAEKPNIVNIANNFIYIVFTGIPNILVPYQEKEIKKIADLKIKIIYINKESLEFLGGNYQESYPFSRSRYAQLLDRLAPLRPKAIGFDILFDLPSKDHKEDIKFLKAIKRHKNVIVVSTTTFQNDLEKMDPLMQNDQKIEIKKETLPIIIPEKLINEHVGYADVPFEFYDTCISTYPWFNMKEPDTVPRLSFALQVYRKAFGIPWKDIKFLSSTLILGSQNIPLDNGIMKINFADRRAFPQISFKDFFDDKQYSEHLSNPDMYENIWLVGWDGESNKDFIDTFRTPVGKRPGVEIHADILNTIMRRLFIKALSHPIYPSILSIIIAIFLGILLPKTSHLTGNITFIGMLATLVFGNFFLLVSGNIYFPIFTPLATSVVSFSSIRLYIFSIERKAKERIKALFAGSVSKKVIDAMLDADQRQKLEEMMKGTKVTVTIFYSDIRGFTALSEKLKPQDVFTLLNEYFEPMIKVIYKYDGFLDKFIGDCIMAVFSAPHQHSDDPLRAVKAALEMQEIIKELKEKWKKEGKPVFSVGMGINTGEVILGSLGVVEEEGKWQLTVIGDAVNLAARLYAKAEGGQILISEDTYKHVAHTAKVKPLDPFTVKGKEEPVIAYELLSIQ